MYTYTTTTTVKDVYGKTEEELQIFLQPGQRFVNFRLPIKWDTVLLYGLQIGVGMWRQAATGEVPLLIIETTLPSPIPAFGCGQCNEMADRLVYSIKLHEELQKKYDDLQAKLADALRSSRL
jgi:hypothetical protein